MNVWINKSTTELSTLLSKNLLLLILLLLKKNINLNNKKNFILEVVNVIKIIVKKIIVNVENMAYHVLIFVSVKIVQMKKYI